MTPRRWKGLTDAARWLLGAAMLMAILPPAMALATPVVQRPFDNDYMLVDLGPVPGVPIPYGGVTFVPGDPDTILLAGYSGAEIAMLYAAGLTRDVTGSITGFVGPGIAAVQAYAAGGSMAYGPGGVLFYIRVTFELGEVKPNSAVTDKVVSLRPLTYYYAPTGLNFVPPGLGGAGTLKLVVYSDGEWWSATIAPDANGTYDVPGGTKLPITIQGYPVGFTYVAPGTPGPLSPGMLVCEHELGYGLGKVSRYDVDANGDPIPGTRQVIVSGLDVPEGIAIDPATGDVLFVGYQGRLYLLRSAPLPPTTTTTTSTSTTTSNSTSTSAVPTTTTSSTKVPMTTTSSSTTLPTTTSTTVRSTTTTSTTAHPTTTTTSTTVRPTTTSTSTSIVPTTTTTSSTTLQTTSTTAPTTTSTMTTRPTTTSTSSTVSSTSSTTSTSRAPASSSTTTTLPPPCGIDPSFEWIGCRLDALLALVRSSRDLGSLQARFVARVEQAQATLDQGAQLCAGGRRASAREALDRLGQQMLLVRARTRTPRARKTIPRPLAQLIADQASDIAADARALRAQLQCP